MGYELLAIDLDKTLLNNRYEVSPRNRDALKRCKARGIYVILASGREVETMDRYSDALEIYDPIISCAGAIICNERMNGKRDVLYHKPVPRGIIDNVAEFARSMGWCLIVHRLGEILALGQDRYTDLYTELTEATITFVDDFYEALNGTQPVKLTIATKPDTREFVYRQFLRRWGTEVNITKTNPEFVEVNARDANKGNALTELCEMLRVPLSRVMAFGDNYSDMPMLQISGGKVLMENASDEIKSALKRECDDLIIAPCNEDDGVACVIESMLW